MRKMTNSGKAIVMPIRGWSISLENNSLLREIIVKFTAFEMFQCARNPIDDAVERGS